MAKNVDGMVNQMNRITASFTAMKVVLVFCIACMAATAVASVYFYTLRVGEMQSKIYVIDNGNTLSAHAQESSVTRKDEVMDMMQTFHRLMFNLPPNNDMIKRNMEIALGMADRSVYRYYNDLQESGFYKRLTSTNSYQQVDIQTVDIDMSVYPYAVVVKGFQYINRESNVSQYSLVTRCRVANAVRSPQNLHGLMIENFEVVENSIIETRDK